MQPQSKPSATEETVAGVRQQYNTAVQDLNTKREVFPTNFIANSNTRFAAREYFEVLALCHCQHVDNQKINYSIEVSP